ncbi:carboxylesterase type B [Asticcacaulis biprosthecium C19]|uniref:Carboxylesterase type B n=1 Tax=Asticcacaulis biprosthecium C19 TaxID=715226 RepID=F4QLJ0_9CAUL|nr:alpha/beta hydrolase [Asticcacaulis biprosthecium]EGF93488.1 carboxylesterase type B [Asticcacaulis biprosthecium C19]
MLEDLTKNLEKLADKMLGKDDPNAPNMPDGDMQKVLDALASLNPIAIETLTPEEARRQPTPADGAQKVMREKGMDPTDPMGVETRDIQYTGAAGPLAARVYTPEGASPDKPLPVILYFHGGGFVIADIDVYDSSPRALAKLVNAVVISAEYRHAPEHKFPAAHDDAFAAYKWVLDNAAGLDGDTSRVALVGESAGGNLALATAIKARDEGLQAPVRQVLVYPVAGTDMTTPSYRLYANAKPLNKAMMEWFVGHYLNGEQDKLDPRIDPIGQADLKGLPDTTLIMAEIDPLCSDGEILAQKLKSAGVNVNSRVFEGATHEFFGMALVTGEAKLAGGMAAMDLRGSF